MHQHLIDYFDLFELLTLNQLGNTLHPCFPHHIDFLPVLVVKLIAQLLTINKLGNKLHQRLPHRRSSQAILLHHPIDRRRKVFEANSEFLCSLPMFVR